MLVKNYQVKVLLSSLFERAYSLAVEHLSYTQGVIGSNPVAPKKNKLSGSSSIG